MLETDAERQSFNRMIWSKLAERSGGPWKEVWCEAQPKYNEMVFSILLYEDSNLKETHQEFCDIISSHVEEMKPLEAHLSYDKYVDGSLLCVATLAGNVSVLSSSITNELEMKNCRYQNSINLYEATHSKRTN